MTKKPVKRLAQRLREGETLIGTLVSLHCSDTTELLARSGFDWLFIDAEHGAFTPGQAKSLLQAAYPVPCLIRIPCADEVWIKKALDIGADGIIVP
ncbi:MAG: aldolase/citrate lyase family protein, partial [Gammaproteobacteria bacterium]|nr:aldolase/citrate lyase family protein [Gammaproteobacteria bacterium]